jgi:crooked neck
VAGDIARARSVYTTAVKLCETVNVTFAKLFKAFAEFELRQLEVARFRAVFSHALRATEGLKKSIPRFWIETELKLGNVHQARRVAAELVEVNPSAASSWLSFIDLELALGESARASALCEVTFKSRDAIDDFPAVARKQIEIAAADDADAETMRKLYKRLLRADVTDGDSYLAFAEFELSESLDRSCAILEEALERIPEDRISDRQRVRSRLNEILQDQPLDDQY